MDDDRHTLEAELKGLRPARISPRLLAAVEKDLVVPEPTRGRWIEAAWKIALPLGAAAAIIFFSRAGADAFVAPDTATVKSSEHMLKPVKLEQLLVAAEDEGLVTLADGTPARRARLQFVDTVTWRNPATNASLSWTVPREEVRVVPVRFQ